MMCSNTSYACQFYANMRLLHISLTAAFFTYFSKVHISHIFPHKPAFSTAILILFLFLLPSVLLRCWLGGRKGIWPVKKLEWWGTGMVICLERDADLHMAQLMPLPLNVSGFSKIQIGFTFLVPAHPGSPGKGPLNGCVCVCFYYLILLGFITSTI